MEQLGLLAIEPGSEVKVRGAGAGQTGVWRVLGQVPNSGPDDPAWDVTNVRNGRRRIFRSSQLVVQRPPRAGARQRARARAQR
jgi:hypothetical protein